MNKRQKLVQGQFLDNEEAVIKSLEDTYSKALEDVTKKSQKLYDDIETLTAELDFIEDEDEREIQKSKIRSKVYQKQYQDGLKTQISSVLDKMHDENFKNVSEYLEKCYEDGFVGTLYDLQGQGLPLAFPIDQEAVTRAVQLDSKISGGLYSHLGEDVAKLKKHIASEVSRGISSGMTFNQIAQQISFKMKGAYKNSGGSLAYAKRIARTEGHRIQCQAGMDACYKAKEKGADVVKQWDSTLDAKTRDSHVEVDQQIREIDEPFSNGLMFPGDPSGGAAEVVNCRCALLQRARWAVKGGFTKMNNFTKELESFESPEDYDEFKKAFFSKENRNYMNYTEQMQEKYKTKDFQKLLEKMDDREYNHLMKLQGSNPIFNKNAAQVQAGKTNKFLTNNGTGAIIPSKNGNDEALFDAFVGQCPGISQSYQDVLNQRYSQGNDTAKKVFNKFVPSDSVANSAYSRTAHFDPVTRKVNMNFADDLQNQRGKGTTFFHEHGHLIDFFAAGTGNYEYVSTNSATFGAALRSDFKKYVNSIKKQYNCNRDDAFLHISMGLLGSEKHSVSDLMGGLSKNKCRGSYGHRTNYWTRLGALEHEAFAHMYEAQFEPKKRALIQQYFPTALTEFENIIKGAI